ncbi:unnamed protein product [Ceutorhynchus assimilis]|uniref:Dynein regulatory complex protein 9 n=1 Tax=Ceutorhynchus assimilis TaxID=467358 RepID=A0A9N9MUU5_9CUCU|nr:unnamed protein product [Ceutorhynchus assimilis]
MDLDREDLILSEDYVSTIDNEFINISSEFDVVHFEKIFDVEKSKFVINLIVSVLNECMNELAILRSVNLQNDLGLNPDKLLQYTTVEERYMGQENHAEYRINSTNSNFDKLAKDINMFYVLFKEVCQEIRAYGTYNVMQDTFEIIKRMQKEEEDLLEDEANQEKVIKDLVNCREQERIENIHTIEETNSKIQKLKFLVEDIYIYGQHEVQYFNKWEQSRMEQNILKNKGKEQHYETIISKTNIKMQQENRCDNELERYFEETRNDAMEEIQQWMKQYDEDTEQLESNIAELKINLDEITEQRIIANEKYAKRQAEIDDWLEYRRIKEAKELQRMKEIKAATKIQAWWRGVMFRKQLGPYRKKKKGKGKDKKGKKKGKK